MTRMILSALLVFVLAACGGASQEAKEAEQKLLQEAAQLDSISTEMQTAKEAIEDAAKNVDDLLNDL